MTVRVVGWLDDYEDDQQGPEFQWMQTANCTDPVVSLPAVIEALGNCFALYDNGTIESVDLVEINAFFAELKQLTTPADAGGRVK